MLFYSINTPYFIFLIMSSVYHAYVPSSSNQIIFIGLRSNPWTLYATSWWQMGRKKTNEETGKWNVSIKSNIFIGQTPGYYPLINDQFVHGHTCIQNER